MRGEAAAVAPLRGDRLDLGFGDMGVEAGAVLAREVARRMPRVDYRALAAATFLGLGSIWAQGLSGSAALQMATPGALQPPIREIVSGGPMMGVSQRDLDTPVSKGTTGILVLTRIAGLLLAAIAVQLVADGVFGFIEANG